MGGAASMAYVGQIIDIPFGRAGLTGTRNLLAVRPDQLIEASNVSYEGGTLQKARGAPLYTAALAGAPAILGGWDWWPDTSTQRVVILASAGTLLKDAGLGTFPVTLKTGLTTAGVVPVFVEAGKEAVALPRRLFVFTGRNPVQVLEADGATTADVATPPTDWAGVNQTPAGAPHAARGWRADAGGGAHAAARRGRDHSAPRGAAPRGARLGGRQPERPAPVVLLRARYSRGLHRRGHRQRAGRSAGGAREP